MAQVMKFVPVVGTILKIGSSIRQGEAANNLARAEAAQLDANGKAAIAQSHRKVENSNRQKDIMQSRQRVVAAAGGGSATDVGVLDLIGDVEKEGKLSALNALFEGKTADQSLRTQAKFKRFEGKQRKRQGYANALSTALSQSGKGGNLRPSSYKKG